MPQHQNNLDISAFEKAIGVLFENVDLYYAALTHRSYLNEEPGWPHGHNERLEYLGDAVLELAVSEALYKKFPDSPEGKLTLLRAALVNYQLLARIAEDMGLNKFILMSRGENRDIGKAREVILANAIEALIGAIYLDRGFEASREFIARFVLVRLDEIMRSGSYKDAKSELQELIQERKKLTPSYRVLEESGPAHERKFRIGVYFGDELIAEGEGMSKQEGEIEAARRALEKTK
ncbi:MAG: ribonuclease III [Candidatus Liptonbacteria bacterium]|nr:ribonuclease III [Candidatus Liptonbacteria bacterium]